MENCQEEPQGGFWLNQRNRTSVDSRLGQMYGWGLWADMESRTCAKVIEQKILVKLVLETWPRTGTCSGSKEPDSHVVEERSWSRVILRCVKGWDCFLSLQFFPGVPNLRI